MQNCVMNKKHLAMVKILWLRTCHTIVNGLDLKGDAIYSFMINNRKVEVIKKCQVFKIEN